MGADRSAVGWTQPPMSFAARTSSTSAIVGLVALALLLAAPPVLIALGARFWINIIAEVMIWSLLAASVNLLFGYTGLLSFGQALYFGMAAYGVAIGIDNFGLSFWPAFGLGIVAAVTMALVTGIFAV